MLQAPLLEAVTVLRLERDVWSMAKRLRQATKEYPPPRPLPHFLRPPSIPLLTVCLPSKGFNASGRSRAISGDAPCAKVAAAAAAFLPALLKCRTLLLAVAKAA